MLGSMGLGAAAGLVTMPTWPSIRPTSPQGFRFALQRRLHLPHPPLLALGGICPQCQQHIEGLEYGDHFHRCPNSTIKSASHDAIVRVVGGFAHAAGVDNQISTLFRIATNCKQTDLTMTAVGGFSNIGEEVFIDATIPNPHAGPAWTTKKDRVGKYMQTRHDDKIDKYEECRAAQPMPTKIMSFVMSQHGRLHKDALKVMKRIAKCMAENRSIPRHESLPYWYARLQFTLMNSQYRAIAKVANLSRSVYSHTHLVTCLPQAAGAA
jgi:hypothetical protein